MKSTAWWLGVRVAVLVGLLKCAGVYGTIRLLLNAFVLRRPGSRFSVKVRGLRQPVTVRAHSSDVFVFAQIFALQEYNFDEYEQRILVDERYQEILKSGKKPLIIDCGANVGFSSIWYAARFPEAVVIAVEASPEAIATLRENVAPYPNIVPLHAAIWDVPEQLRIANPGAETWLVQVAAVDADSSEANAGQGDLDVGTATISDLIRQYPDTTPFITKIDIEGAESALFRSNTEWMSAMVLIAIELHDRHYPFKFIGRNFYREIGKHNVEIVFSMENIFVFFRAPDDDRPV